MSNKTQATTCKKTCGKCVQWSVCAY